MVEVETDSENTDGQTVPVLNIGWVEDRERDSEIETEIVVSIITLYPNISLPGARIHQLFTSYSILINILSSAQLPVLVF